jgi:hypothetical protein
VRQKVHLCTECGKRPQAPLGWFLCWECEALWDAQRTIRAGENLLAEGRRKLAYAQDLLAKAEAPPSPAP